MSMKRERSLTNLEQKDEEMYRDLKISKKNVKVTKEIKITNKKKGKIDSSGGNKRGRAKSSNKLEKKKPKSKSRAKSNENIKPKNKSAVKAKSKKKEKSSKSVKKIKKIVKEDDDSSRAVVKKEENVTIAKSDDKLGPKCIRLGLCCLNNFLKNRKNPIFCSRSIILATYKSKGKLEAITRATENINDIEKLLKWNKAHYIECLRLSSDLLPHYSNHSRIEEDNRYTLEFAKKDLERVGKLVKEYGHRVTMHPGQFNVVGSPNEAAFQQTIIDLKMHADILDLMQMDENSVMVVHGGGVYGDKKKTIQRWIDNFKRLPENVQKRLVLENDEKNFSIVDCLEVNEAIGIPIVFDNHHFLCYKQMHPDDKFEDIRVYIKQVIDIWVKKGLRPKFHISEQAQGKLTGAHSDYIEKFPDYYLEIPEKYGIGVDVMVEAKAKEAAILDLYQKYKTNFLSRFEDQLKDKDKNIFNFDREKMQAIKCSDCPDF